MALIILLIFNTFFFSPLESRAENESKLPQVSSASIDSVYKLFEHWRDEHNWTNASFKTLQELRLNKTFNTSIGSTVDALYNRSVRNKDVTMQLSCIFLKCLIADQNYNDLNTVYSLSDEAYRLAAQLSVCDEINIRRFIAEIIGNPKYKKQKESYAIYQKLKYEATQKKCWSNLVSIYLNESDLINANFYDVQESLILKLQAVDIASRHIPNSYDHAFAISECGKAYFHAYAIQEAISCWKIAEKMYHKLNLSHFGDLIRINNDLALAYTNLKNADSADYYFTKAFNLAVKANSELWKGIIQGNRGSLMSLRGNYEDSKKLLRNDFDISLRAHEIESSSATALQLAIIYLKEKKLIEAKTYLDTARLLLDRALTEKPYSSGFGVNRSWLTYYKSLGQYYKLNKEYSKSVDAYQTFITFNDSLNGAQKYRELALKATLQHQLKNEVLTRKEKEDENQALIKQSEYKSKLMLALLALMVVVAGFAFLLYRSKEDLKKAISDLKEQKEKIENQQEALKLITIDLKKSNEELSRLNHLKDKLFSLVAHDLRSPLNTLRSVMTLFKDGDITEDSLKTFVPQIEENVGETLNMLDNLLNWAKSQLDGFKVKPQHFEINELVIQNFKLMASEANKKDVKLINNLTISIKTKADKEMINLVLRNLIHNAIKFTHPGDRIVVDGANLDQEILINLSDTGVGMTEEQLIHINEKRMSSTLGTANERGTGLGLQLCFDFIKLNGGKIEVHSRKGQGTVFSIYLPLSEA